MRRFKNILLYTTGKVEDRAVLEKAMGTLARTGIAGLFIGNTAEAVLHQVNCSVLTVKPEGFVTPVKPEGM
jgi:hypothetical protein